MATREEKIVLWTMIGGIGAVLLALPVVLGFRMPMALVEIAAGCVLLVLAYFRLRARRRRTKNDYQTE